MMVETDILYAYVKKEDWLKKAAKNLMLKIEKGEFQTVYASREALHEMYYVSREEGVSIDEYISRVAALTTIKNLVFLETTHEIDLLALNQVPDHSIISTDTVFDRIPGVTRIDPREI